MHRTIDVDVCKARGSNMVNCDYAIHKSNVGVCLADGFGDASVGCALARYACHSILKLMEDDFSPEASIAKTFREEQSLIDLMQLSGSGVSIASVLFEDEAIRVAWMGDVCCYLLRKGQDCAQLMTPPDRYISALTNGIGIPNSKPNSVRFNIASGDKVLLCSDGVWDEIDQDELSSVMAEAKSPGELSAKLTICRKPIDDASAIAMFVQ